MRFKPEAKYDKLFDMDQADPDIFNDPDEEAFQIAPIGKRNWETSSRMLRKDKKNQIIYPETAEDTAADLENEAK